MQSWLPSRTQPRLRILPRVMNDYLAQDVPDRLMPKKVTLYIIWGEILKLFHKASQLEICDRNNIGWEKSNAEETCGLELTTWMTSIIASGYLYTGNITAFRTRHCDRCTQCTAISQTSPGVQDARHRKWNFSIVFKSGTSPSHDEGGEPRPELVMNEASRALGTSWIGS